MNNKNANKTKSYSSAKIAIYLENENAFCKEANNRMKRLKLMIKSYCD